MFKTIGYVRICIWRRLTFELTGFCSPKEISNPRAKAQSPPLAHLCNRAGRVGVVKRKKSVKEIKIGASVFPL